MVVEGESVAIVVTLDSDPGEDIEVQFRLGETGADDITFTPDRIAVDSDRLAAAADG